MKGEMGMENTQAIIMQAIQEAAILTGSAMTPDLKAMAAKNIVNDFWFLHMDEILLALANGSKGLYGKIYGQINFAVIYEWINKYDQERQYILEGMHTVAKNSAGNNAERSPEPRVTKDIFLQAVDQKVQQRINAYKNKAEENEDY